MCCCVPGAAIEHVALPVVAEVKPDMIIVASGFDAAQGDILGKYVLEGKGGCA